MPEKPIKPQVVVRHGREPVENRQFARRLADLLRQVGFEVKLVEEQESSDPPLDQAGHALSIVSRAWLEHRGAGAELDRSIGQTAVNHRHVVVCREPIDERRIPDQLRDLPTVEWLPDDPEPDARFWEVYCGLTRNPPGDRNGRAGRGRDLLASPIQRPTSPESTDRLNCPARPSLARPWPGGTFLLTDSGACFQVDSGGAFRLRQLPDLDGCSAVAVDGKAGLVVGLYNGMWATLVDDEWDYQPAEAAVLSLASTPQGLAVGDSAGSVTFADPRGRAVASASLGEPVVELVAFEEGVVALGARGGLWRVGPLEAGPVPIAVLRPNEALGRPVGLFDTGDPCKVGVFSIERVALLASGGRSPRVGVRRFPEGIGAVVEFGRKDDAPGSSPIGLLTDAGQVWTISADLNTVAPVLLPEAKGEVVGLATGASGGLLAWTSGGTAYAIARDRSSRTLATSDVALAIADPGRLDQVTLVFWYPDRTVQVRRLWPDLAR